LSFAKPELLLHWFGTYGIRAPPCMCLRHNESKHNENKDENVIAPALTRLSLPFSSLQ